VQDEKPIIAHLHNIYHQITPAIIPVLKKEGAKVVLTLHDCKLICPSYLALRNGLICTECNGKVFSKLLFTKCQDSYSRSLLLAFEPWWHKLMGSYDDVDIFIAPSKFLADLVSDRIPRGKIKIL